MPKVSKSVVREIGADEIRAFSSFDDYVSALISEGVVKSSQDLVARRPDLLGSILFKWYQQGQIACIFARLLAMKPETQWPSITIEGNVDVEQLEAVLREAAENQEALQLVFPGSGTAKQAVDLTKSLCQHPSWSCKEIPWFEDEKGRSLQVGLRWHLEDSNYLSWVLGIAPFDPMPFTRRFAGAPFVALVFRTTPPTDFIPAKYESNLQAAHLAHMNDTLGDDQAKRKMFTDGTARAKRALLGSELLSTARAKVTFALPLWCRNELGDTLTKFEEEPKV
jgi:hypothetical protein